MIRFSRSKILLSLLLVLVGITAEAQKKKLKIEVLADKESKKVLVLVDGKEFTAFIYPDSLEKPVLFPIRAANGTVITRGWPVEPRNGDPTDHPHHFGLWLNYESVNGLDFWNNSYAIPQDKKNLYGWIRTTAILSTKSGRTGGLAYSAQWTDEKGNLLITENTSFEFTAGENDRVIDRICSLTAAVDISMPDIKDGLLGLRVAHELEIPGQQTTLYTDNKGNSSAVAADTKSTGNYLTSAGKTGDSAWGTRGSWCLLFGKMGTDSISVAIIDHPANPGYPSYWHARGYGLFAANPLGQKIFSNGKEELNFKIPKGQTVIFRYRIIIHSGSRPLSASELNKSAELFSKEKG